MRSLIVSCLLVAASGLLAAQTSQEFHNRYGLPDRERFIVRSGIGLTVQYGSDFQACEVLIEIPKPLLREASALPSPIASDEVTGLLEELAPAASRGDEIHKVLQQSGCNEVHITDYTKPLITRSIRSCLGPKLDMRASIVFKRGACQSKETDTSKR